MMFEEAVSTHYTHGELLGAIKDSIIKSGKAIDSITTEDLAPIDEFHIGGRVATENLLGQLRFSKQDPILDVGCGLGGTSRFVAGRYGNIVTGVDLTREYIEVGRVLNSWVGLERQVTLCCSSALSMPFGNSAFGGAIMLHVGMNIEDKASLFGEVCRVLRPGACFGIYDVMSVQGRELLYPVPWANTKSASALATSNQYRRGLEGAGFEVIAINERRDFALEILGKTRSQRDGKSSQPPLGLHILMQNDAAEKVSNMISNIKRGLVVPVEIVARK